MLLDAGMSKSNLSPTENVLDKLKAESPLNAEKTPPAPLNPLGESHALIPWLQPVWSSVKVKVLGSNA